MNPDQVQRLISLGLGTIAVVLVLLLLWQGLQKWVPAAIETSVRLLLAPLAGTRLVCGYALRRYRQNLAEWAKRLPVVFGEKGVDLRSVYVPLEADQAGERQDAFRSIREASHAVVLGSPGSGKSMLLRYSMLAWTLGGRGRRVPVLLELHRCTGEVELATLICEQLTRMGFRKPERFVQRGLRSGRLAVLLDGLDEVKAENRTVVVRQIRDFVQSNGKCQIVVTCRSAIYRRQLEPEITATYHVLDFDEKLVRRFLTQSHSRDDVHQLMEVLHRSPRMMQLARNPLLLTMISYLHERGLQLPHSRARFYEQAMRELLGDLKEESNGFAAPVKREVLRQLALAAQDVPRHEADRRALPFKQVVSVIKEVLPALNVEAGKANDVLYEIVTRSGLLLEVDGGERYQFAHLSLQEFLAAEALAAEPDVLLHRYQDDPDTWLETVKLWCGVTALDCTVVIEGVRVKDPLLAFECLADARAVTERVADELIDEFLLVLVDGKRAVVEAFGSVAADRRERGRRVYELLADEAVNGNDAACAALAATRLPHAVTLLRDLGKLDHLVGLGDLAVRALRDSAERGEVKAVRLLHQIGTPFATRALAELLGRGDRVSEDAAWYLAALVTDPEAEAALAGLQSPVPSKLDWVWLPFSSDRGTIWVMGQVVSRLQQAPALRMKVDARLAIAICGMRLSKALERNWVPLPWSVRGPGQKRIGPMDRELRKWLRKVIEDENVLALFGSLGKRVRVNLVVGVARRGRPLQERDWIEVGSAGAAFHLRRTWQHLAAQGLVLASFLAVAVTGTQVDGASLPEPLTPFGQWLWSSVVASWSIATALLLAGHGDRAFSLNVAVCYMALHAPALFLAAAVLPSVVGVRGLLLALTVLGVSVNLLLVWAVRRQRRARNPLRSALLLHEQTRRSGASIIAN